MAETLRELVVVLSLDSSNFSRNMRSINQQIKEAESTFRLAGAGVENFEKTVAGTEAKHRFYSFLSRQIQFLMCTESFRGSIDHSPKYIVGDYQSGIYRCTS